MKKRVNILKFRILMLTAELIGLNADSRVWMKELRAFFHPFEGCEVIHFPLH